MVRFGWMNVFLSSYCFPSSYSFGKIFSLNHKSHTSWESWMIEWNEREDEILEGIERERERETCRKLTCWTWNSSSSSLFLFFSLPLFHSIHSNSPSSSLTSLLSCKHFSTSVLIYTLNDHDCHHYIFLLLILSLTSSSFCEEKEESCERKLTTYLVPFLSSLLAQLFSSPSIFNCFSSLPLSIASPITFLSLVSDSPLLSFLSHSFLTLLFSHFSPTRLSLTVDCRKWS